MDFGIVLRTIGLLFLVESLFMLPSLAIAYVKGQSDFTAFLVSILVTFSVGLALHLFARAKTEMVRYREGFMIVGLGWLGTSLFGALPFYLSGALPRFIDAVFESVSGFTTTGATVVQNIEILPHGLLFWRSLTHWLGGMGILVFTIIVLPTIGVGAMKMFKAESPGPTPGKLAPRLKQTAKILYGIYLIITVAQIVFLKIAGMSLFDSFTHAFATMGTGGFSTRNASIGAFSSPSFDWIIILFMVMAGANFSLYFDAFLGNVKTLIRDKEFQFYMGVIAVAIILLTMSISSIYGNVFTSIRHAAFQAVSIITTTGFTTVNYELWPEFSRMLLFLLMFFGGCAGSTGGAIKQVRILLVLKYIKRELSKLVHPKAVIAIRIGDKPISEETVQNVMGFVLLYMILFALTSLLLLTQGMDILSSTSAVAATLGNVGPGLGMVGPANTYADLSSLAKMFLAMCMLLGRLELYTIMALLVPAFWRS